MDGTDTAPLHLHFHLTDQSADTDLDKVPEWSQLSDGLRGYRAVSTNDHVTSRVLKYLINESSHTGSSITLHRAQSMCECVCVHVWKASVEGNKQYYHPI